MNYERIIVELLSRIQTLEEKVDFLMGNQAADTAPKTHDEIVRDVVGAKTKDIREYIETKKTEAKTNGEEFIVFKAGDLHRIMRLKNGMPMVCNAMRQCMGVNDVVLYETPSGYSSTLEIKYML